MLIKIESSCTKASEHLSDGRAIAVPGPLKFPYVIAGNSAAVVNRAKMRPAEQKAIIVVSDLQVVAPFVDLTPDGIRYSEWLSSKLLLHLLVPIKESHPAWADGAISDGLLGVSLAWHPQLRCLLQPLNYVFASSANITGDSPMGTAREVDAQFDSRILVVDADHESGDGAISSGMIVQLDRDLTTQSVRGGFQAEEAAQSPGEFAGQLLTRWRQYA